MIPGRHGSIDFGGAYEPIEFTLRGQIRGSGHQDFLTKKSKFLRWLDIAPRVTQEFITLQHSIRALAFELSGHEYHYTTGTVTATTGSNVITGSGTRWTTVAFPGAKFTLSNDNTNNIFTRYYVKSVVSDTSLYLTSNVSGAGGSGLNYKLERRRFLLVNYAGSSDISALSGDHAHFVDTHFPFSINLRAVYPFWVGDWFQQEQASASNFISLYGLGYSPFNPVYQLVGDATNPEITVAKHSFVCWFDDMNTSGVPTKARMVGNKTDVTADAFTNDFRYATGKLNQAVGIFSNTLDTQGDVFSFPTMLDGSSPANCIADRINLNQGTISLWFRPEWDGNDGKSHYLFQCVNGGNFVTIYKHTDNTLYAHWQINSVGTSATFSAASMTAGTWYHVVFHWDATNYVTGSVYSQMYVNNSAGTGSSTVRTKNGGATSSTATLGKAASTSSAWSNSYLDDFVIWDRPLSATEISSLYNSGTGARADTNNLFRLRWDCWEYG